MNKKLAIVIPAYKETYFETAVSSIANQTCKDFTLYVGNDCGSDEIGFITEKYSSRIDIVYHRFDENLGGKDLVAQWERCIAMTQDEEWIWLFSDDDVMGKRCVELFYETISSNDFDIYHFNVKEIDGKGNETGNCSKYQDITHAFYLYENKMMCKLLSLVVENVFSREIYQKCHGFQRFDLAWGSDTATWIKFCSEKGMKTIDGDYVYWRNSGENITATVSSQIVERKLNALLDFFSWSKKYFYGSVPPWRLRSINLYAYMIRLRSFVDCVPKSFLNKNITSFLKMHHFTFLYLPMKLVLTVFKK